MILAIRTDSDQAHLVLCQNRRELERHSWIAGRQLSATLLDEIRKLLGRHQANWSDLDGVIVYQGPGSFTGLRIGATVANSIAYSVGCLIVGTSGENWLEQGLSQIKKACPDAKSGQVIPEYGAEPNISKPSAKSS